MRWQYVLRVSCASRDSVTSSQHSPDLKLFLTYLLLSCHSHTLSTSTVQKKKMAVFVRAGVCKCARVWRVQQNQNLVVCGAVEKNILFLLRRLPGTSNWYLCLELVFKANNGLLLFLRGLVSNPTCRNISYRTHKEIFLQVHGRKRSFIFVFLFSLHFAVKRLLQMQTARCLTFRWNTVRFSINCILRVRQRTLEKDKRQWNTYAHW
jgi:hypothetical protein